METCECCEQIKLLNFTRDILHVSRKLYVKTNHYLKKTRKNAFYNNKIL